MTNASRNDLIELDVDDATGQGLAAERVRAVVEFVIDAELEAEPDRLIHVGVQFVEEARIADLNLRYRGRKSPTDVLSFPVDASTAVAGPRELGDVVICPDRCGDKTEGLVHGLLHLLGYDHEADGGEMLATQERLIAELAGATDG